LFFKGIRESSISPAAQTVFDLLRQFAFGSGYAIFKKTAGARLRDRSADLTKKGGLSCGLIVHLDYAS
jgi:hypothetical protein